MEEAYFSDERLIHIFDLQSFILVNDDNVVDRAASRWHLETAVLVECTAIFEF